MPAEQRRHPSPAPPCAVRAGAGAGEPVLLDAAILRRALAGAGDTVTTGSVGAGASGTAAAGTSLVSAAGDPAVGGAAAGGPLVDAARGTVTTGAGPAGPPFVPEPRGSAVCDRVVAPDLGGRSVLMTPGEFPTVVVDPLSTLPRRRCLPVPVVEAVGPTSWGERLATVAPGPDLAALAAVLDPDTTATQDLVEMVAAADRLVSWAHHLRARWARELADRPEMHPRRTTGTRPEDGCVAADEVSMRLGTSRREAAGVVAEGVAFTTTLFETGQALSVGAISPEKARVLTRRLADVPVLVAQEVEDRVLPGASGRTVTQLTRDVERALVRVDAEGAADRHNRARSGRRVSHPRMLPDGMARVSCTVPAVDAMRIDGVLESTARALRAGGDGRTLHQARADVLRDLVIDGVVVVRAPMASTVPVTCDATARLALVPSEPRVGNALTAPTDPAAETAPTDPAAETAPTDPAAETAPTNPAAETAPTDPTDPTALTGPGARTDASALTDPTAPTDPSAPTGAGDGEDGSGPSGTGDPSGTREEQSGRSVPTGRPETPERHAPPERSVSSDAQPPLAPRCTRAHATAAIHVTVSLSTLLGLDEEPANLHGYGPIGADQAREVAHAAGSTWRRIVTDARSDAVLDVGRTRYAPPAPLAAHVRARDRRCAAPGCDIAAECCDLDHTVEFHGVPHGPPAPPGTTAAGNLGPLCRQHHGIKTDRGFVLRQPGPGTFVWTTPAGHHYRTRPGADRGFEHLAPDGRPWPRPLTQAEMDERDGDPPF